MARTIAENQTITFSEVVRTWRTEIESPYGENPFIKIYREAIRTYSDGTSRSDQDLTPIVVQAADLPKLADFAQIPPELAAAIPSKAALVKMLKLLGAVVSIACDAADVRRIEEAAQEGLTQDV